MYENLLNIGAYLDKAPKEVQDFLNALKSNILKSLLLTFENTMPEEHFNIIKSKFENMPFAQLIIEVGKMEKNSKTQKNDYAIMESMNLDEDIVKFKLSNNFGIPVNDNSMEPYIYKGSSVILEILPEYKSGDILCLKLKKSTDYLIRTCMFNKNNILIQPLNLADFKPIEVNKKDVTILGKVKRITRDLY